MENLSVGSIISQGINKGLKNFPQLFVNLLLWLITIWIPYINIGTTICLMTLAVKMSKDEPISFTEVFNPIYRKRMGEILLAGSLMFSAVFIGILFFIIPGIVIGLSWGLALFLIIDKEMNPLEAINKSNSLTYGKKWTIFFGIFLVTLITVGGSAVLCAILGLVFPGTPMGEELPLSLITLPHPITGLVQTVLAIISAAIGIGAWGHIYGTLSKNA